MSRNKKKNANSTQVTVHLSPEMALAVDNYAVGFGLESRAAALTMLATAGMSSLPLDAAIGTMMQQAVAATKKAEFEALVKHFEERAAIYRAAIS